jgi:hypothetical protein
MASVRTVTAGLFAVAVVGAAAYVSGSLPRLGGGQPPDDLRPVEVYVEWSPAKQPASASVHVTGPYTGPVDASPAQPPYHTIVKARVGAIVVVTATTHNGATPDCELVGPDGTIARRPGDGNHCSATLHVSR